MQEDLIPVLYNTCFGGFHLSKEAIRIYGERSGATNLSSFNLPRTDSVLAEVVKELGDAANGMCSSIKTLYVPRQYKNFVSISEYDGLESVSVDFARYKLQRIVEAIKEEGVTKEQLTSRINGILEEDEIDVYNAYPSLNETPEITAPRSMRSHFPIQ